METRRTAELGRMSWAEIAEVLPRNPVLLLPIGTVEQHGPYLPVNADNMAANVVALRAAEQTDAYVLPGINYGCSTIFRKFPGTISIRQETLGNIIRDVCHALLAQGFRRFIFVDNHGGNVAVCEQVARELKEEHGIIIGNLYPWDLGKALIADTYENVTAAYGHGAEPETSAMLAMFPDDVVRERMEVGGFQPFAGWEPQHYTQITVPGQTIKGTVYLDGDEIAPNGMANNIGEASAERGGIWIERVVGFAVAFIRHYDEVTRNSAWTNRALSR